MKSLKEKVTLVIATSMMLALLFVSCSVDSSDSPAELLPMQTVATPVFTVESGEVTSGVTVETTCSTEGAAIYYTTDGSVPTAESTRYTDPITIEPPMTVKAIAIKKGMNNSAVAEAEYTKTISDYFGSDGCNIYGYCFGISNESFGSYIISKADGNKARIYIYRDNNANGAPLSQETLSYSVSGNIASLKGESGTEFAINIKTNDFVTKKIVFNGNLYIYHTVTLKLSKSDTTPFRTFTIEEGKSTKLPDSGIVAPSGNEYRFFGWKNNTGRKVDSNSFSATSNDELIAIWLAPSGYYKTKYENGFHWEASNLYSKDNPHWKEEDEYPLSGEISSGEKIINIIQSDESELKKIKEINYESENDRVYLITIEGYFFSSEQLKSIPIDYGMATITCDFDNNRTLLQAKDGYFINDEGYALEVPCRYYILDEETQQYWCEVE